VSEILGAPGPDPDPQKEYEASYKINPTVESQKVIDSMIRRQLAQNIRERLEQAIRRAAIRENEIAALKEADTQGHPLDRKALLGQIEALNRELDVLGCILIDALRS
jgi:hypothetical protein